MVYYKSNIWMGDDVDLTNKAVVIGRNIRALRIRKGMSAKELADLVGVKKSTISNYENARSMPKKDTIARIANALQTSADNISYDNPRVLRVPPRSCYEDGRIPYYEDIKQFAVPDAAPSAVFPVLESFENQKGFVLKIITDDFEDSGIRNGAYVLFGMRSEPTLGKLLVIKKNDKICMARIEALDEENMKLRIYDGEIESYTEIMPISTDIILGISVMYTVAM